MPKQYSEQEKAEIIRRLKEVAAESLREVGVKKTTVDDLVAKVGIPKGTFYLFYKSKELLLFDVITDIHEEVEQQMMEEMTLFAKGITPDALTDFIFHYYQYVTKTCLMRLMMGNELEYLISKLPDQTVAEHLLSDTDHAADILKMLPPKEGIDAKTVSGAFRGIFLMLPYRREIGNECFDSSIRMLIHGVVLQLFP